MLDDGSTKDDVKVPDNEIGERINKLFNEEQKDTSKSCRFYKLLYPVADQLSRRHHSYCHG
jgi:hypothetical protein